MRFVAIRPIGMNITVVEIIETPFRQGKHRLSPPATASVTRIRGFGHSSVGRFGNDAHIALQNSSIFCPGDGVKADDAGPTPRLLRISDRHGVAQVIRVLVFCH
jgi:hypothetical protein